MDFIIGNYSNQQYANSLAPETLDNQALGYLNNFRISKYELWFTDTISFIPYSQPSVFIIDNSGNITHTGNLTTEKNSLTRGDVTVKGNSLFESNMVVNGTVRIGGDLYVNGQIFSDYLTGLLAGIGGAAASAEPAPPASPAQQPTPAAQPTSVTQNTTIIQQPIYDDVEITFVNPEDSARNSGTLRSISYNGIVANVQNGYQTGGMRTGKYVQDGKRVGIEMILTSDSSVIERIFFDDSTFVTVRRREAPQGFTGTIRLTFPESIREFSIKATYNDFGINNNSERYSAVIRYANNTTKQVPFSNRFVIGQSITDRSSVTINEKTDPIAGDIVEVTLSNGVINEQFGNSFVTYTNLFWK